MHDAAELGARTWTEIPSADAEVDITGPLVVVPVGSCEQHGPHLPLHTDAIVATALARELAAHRDDCLVAPALTITASGEHQGFPGTLSIGTDAMVDVVVQLVRSADWAAGVVFVHGHGGNTTAMARAGEVFAHERRAVLSWWARVPGGDLHAGRTETSLLLALAPDEVRIDAARSGSTPTMAELVRHGVRHLSPNGVLGDPTGATADEGRRLFLQLAEQLTAAVAAWHSP